MSRFVDMFGIKVGRLTPISHYRKGHYTFWKCRCNCGKEKIVRADHLRDGMTLSCGCLLKERQKEPRPSTQKPNSIKKHPIYRLYWDIKRRCFDKKTKCYKNYGGRGITMCDEWLDSYEKFYEYIFPIYKAGMQIDRIDNNKGYEPNNVRFVTCAENMLNRRCTTMYEGIPMKTYCEHIGISFKAVKARHSRGATYKEAIEALISKKINASQS